ncbi:acetyl-CoA carboxylase, carboxyltransferase subunit beta [Haploplasma modicum]|uniref:acetyl-CoA carboxylase, carboxyltransferase subunit beta n=1 Tax=Haploplasma modicum TaxID=2150 RepID=UPI00214C0C3D|nr:acetyl-CoA carboxylase, carboxyltransferase subunit beta [Haploplasma modicum]MCR1809163.1 acetyl-CoA carboxylase, carboxyltransferase subunit beta [Haploplasma modicum]
MLDLLNERKLKIEEFQKIARKKDYKYKPVNIPNHLFTQCEHCLSALYSKDLEQTGYVCPYCGHHFRISATTRLNTIIDKDTFKPLFSNIVSVNILNMPDYDEKLEKGKKMSNLSDAVLTGYGLIDDIKVAIGILDSNFMMGSMGSVVGEKITLLIEYATTNNLPLIIFTASGGARMQEGIYSLMQMAKTSAALNYFNNLYISVLTNPTTGGVAASFASLGDINIAEKTSLIGFAGARVIKQTIKQDLPEGFQTENFQLQKGQVDLIVERKNMKKTISDLLKLHRGIAYE